MSFLDDGDINDISNINWEDDDFDLSGFQNEEDANLIAESNKFEDEEHPTQDHLDALNKFFGHKSFRPMQWKIINSIINDRRDNCAVMATGYGKSLCFQFPSVYCGGLTIVISPLISLMQDQVLSLKMANIPACLLGSAQSKQKKVIQEIMENKYSLVYLTPEFCCAEFGQSLLKQMDEAVSITLIAIDEAHCVSTWGHDFRFQYRELGLLREVLPNIPILAVTATATSRVRNDIVASLGLRNPQVLCSGFDRPNLYFSVFIKGTQGPMADLKKYMVKENNKWTFTGSTIIYCITRKQTEDLTEMLLATGLKCAAYHGSMTPKLRAETHEQFVRDKIKVIVATIAFGMGIDKPDVRRIIHYGSSKDLESYYQEVGRAGRDGQPAECVTFYSRADFEVLRALRETSYATAGNKEHKEAMALLIQKYFDSRDCRRQFILNHFEGTPNVKRDPKPRCCDNCTRKLTEVADNQKYEGLDKDGRYDFTQDTHTFLTAVKTMHGKFGIGSYILLLRGSRSAKMSRYLNNPHHGSGKHKSEEWWKALANLLEREKYLVKVQGNDKFMQLVQLTKKGDMFLQDIVKRPHLAKLIMNPTNEMFKLLKVKERKREMPSQSQTSTKLTPLKLLDNIRESKSKKKPNLSRLKLLKPPEPEVTQSVIAETEVEEVHKEEETCEEKSERMMIYRKLTDKRTELAHKMDCMPYMVASNEALMKMATHKPVTMLELRQCQLEGFNDAKIAKFGPEWVRTVRTLCHLDPELPEEQKRTIEEILSEHPLPSLKKIGMAALSTYNLFKEGLTVSEIATKRGCIPGTVMSHLIDGIKVGYPIKMIDLNIADEDRNLIIGVIKGPRIKSNMSILTPIKMACPDHISMEMIKAVVAYVQVRDHLNRLHIPYEDFEEPYEDILNIVNITKKSDLKLPPNNNLDALVKIGEEVANIETGNLREKPIEMPKPEEEKRSPSPSLMGLSKKRSNEFLEELLSPPPIIPSKRIKTLPLRDDDSQESSQQEPVVNLITPDKPNRRSLSLNKCDKNEEKSQNSDDSDETIIEDSPIKTEKSVVQMNSQEFGKSPQMKKELKFKKLNKRADLNPLFS